MGFRERCRVIGGRRKGVAGQNLELGPDRPNFEVEALSPVHSMKISL